MRISDWSSDVCSSDLKESGGNAVLMFWANPLAPQHATVRENGIRTRLPASVRVATVQFQMRRISQISEFEEQVEYFVDVARSEEHTSELHSLMRISYAVFCLKKKKE